MLKRLKLENFKAWKEVDLQFGKVTGFFGTNSAGKSSLLQFLLMLKQTRDATDRGLILDFGKPGDKANLGTFLDAIHGHDERRRIDWSLEWSLSEKLEWSPSKKMEIRSEVGLRGGRPWPYELTYRFDDADFTLKAEDRSETKFDLTTDSDKIEFIRNRGRPGALSHPVKSYMFSNGVKQFYQNTDFLGDFELKYEELMDSIYYLGPLRSPPQREYRWGGSRPDDVGQAGEHTVDAILAATRENETRQHGRGWKKFSFQEMIAHWLEEFNLIKEFHFEEISGTNLWRVMVKTPRSSVPTALTDVGFGVSQVLPALVLLYYVPERSTVLMEQPEIHLHPAVQNGLADLMLQVAKTRDVQIVVESHSEHFLRRLQRRVAEAKAAAEDVKLYFISTYRDSARASDLKLNEYGEIEDWPDDFFGDEMGEIAAIATNSLKRKLEDAR